MIRLTVLALSLSMVVGKDELTFITADCGGDIILNCTAPEKYENYTSVTWYKFHNSSSSIFLKRSENVIQTDKHSDSVSTDKNTSLVLRKAAPSDSGIYKCLIRARAGGKNSEMQFKLNISDCVSTPINFDFSNTTFINGPRANISIPLTHGDDDSELFVFSCWVGVAVSKLVLSAVFIWVFNELRELRRRSQT